MRTAIVIAFCGLITGCTNEAGPGATPAAPLPRRIEIANGHIEISIAQRSTEVIPGSDDRVLLTIGDVTGGKVTTSISTDDGRSVLSPRSVRESDSVRFTLGDQPYTLTLKKLNNKLIGTDRAKFVIEEEGSDGLSEAEAIERLIDAVENLPDAVFVRNGKEHASAAAAEHWRKKGQRNADQIKTAEDFIRVAATRSSTTGKPYLIRFADGRGVPTADFLLEQLAEIRRFP